MKMKFNKPCYILFIILFSLFYLLNVHHLKAQVFPWSPATKITSGYIDKNPRFGTKQQYYGSLFDWEYLVFERHNDSASNICVLKIGITGAIDTVRFLTNNLHKNINPSISYEHGTSFPSSWIKSSLVLWQNNQNGRWDIYGCYFNVNTGWGNPFPVDTSAFDKLYPRSVYSDNSNFALVYEKNHDIIFRILNAQTKTVTYDTNLTINDTSVCSNPFLSTSNGFFVSYEKNKINSEKEIEYRRSSSLPNWSGADTVAYAGNNISFGMVAYFNEPINVFSSNRLGNYNIYGTILYPVNSQRMIVEPGNSNNTNFESFLYPIITDNGGIYYHAGTFIKKNDSTKLIFSNSFIDQDSLSVGDSSLDVSLTMNRGIAEGIFAKIWVVYNKDSSFFSSLYGKSVTLVIFSNILKTSNEIPNSFSLHQNYPNPFNPYTKIRFDISSQHGKKSSNVKLIIYNELGQEVERLVDKDLTFGSYEAGWDGSKFAVGIYFYKMVTENFSDSKKLLLLK